MITRGRQGAQGKRHKIFSRTPGGSASAFILATQSLEPDSPGMQIVTLRYITHKGVRLEFSEVHHVNVSRDSVTAEKSKTRGTGLDIGMSV